MWLLSSNNLDLLGGTEALCVPGVVVQKGGFGVMETLILLGGLSLNLCVVKHLPWFSFTEP